MRARGFLYSYSLFFRVTDDSWIDTIAVTRVGGYTLTAKQFCQHVDNGLKPETLNRTHPEDEDTSILLV